MEEKTAAEIWSEVIESVERNRGQTDMILRQSKGESLTDGVLTVIVLNAFAKNQIELSPIVKQSLWPSLILTLVLYVLICPPF